MAFPGIVKHYIRFAKQNILWFIKLSGLFEQFNQTKISKND